MILIAHARCMQMADGKSTVPSVGASKMAALGLGSEEEEEGEIPVEPLNSWVKEMIRKSDKLDELFDRLNCGDRSVSFGPIVVGERTLDEVVRAFEAVRKVSVLTLYMHATRRWWQA